MRPPLPEPNRLIECIGFDWSMFRCIAKWVPYKKQSKNKGRLLVLQPDGSFEPEPGLWADIVSWEYIREEKPRGGADNNNHREGEKEIGKDPLHQTGVLRK